jgi:aldose sugar dehydrogenase
MKALSDMLRLVLVGVLLSAGLPACSGSGSGGENTTFSPPPPGGGGTPAPSPPVGTVTLTGSVSGTVIKVLRTDTKAVIATADTASLTNPPFPFSLSGIPVGVSVKVFFFSAGDIFPLYFGNTNVFTLLTSGTVDLGLVTMGGGKTMSANPPPATIQLEAEDLSPLPQNIIPPAATLAVVTPALSTGSVIVNFFVQNFSIGGQGQPHLHIKVQNGPTRHFFNGSTNAVLDDNGQPTTDVVRQTATAFRLDGLAPGNYFVTARLSTASDQEFLNPEAMPAAVPITVTPPPAPPPALTITSPLPGASFLAGPVDVIFTVHDFMIGGQGSPHLHLYLDNGPAYHFFNGTTNQVLDTLGQPVANITRQNTNAFRISGLPSGPHTIRLTLTDAGDQDLPNAEAHPPIPNFSIQSQPGIPTVVVTQPQPNAALPTGPVRVAFETHDFTIGLSGTPHLHFYLDNSPIPHEFFNGVGITEDNGVLYQGTHTHFAHWKSGTSFELYALGAGLHRVRLALANANHTELGNTEAAREVSFTVNAAPSGELQLVPVRTGLDWPVAMAFAPDGRLFVNEQFSGRIRVINTATWEFQQDFCQVPSETGSTLGLLGIALDLSFTTNQRVYVYHTAVDLPFRNRILRYTGTGGTCGSAEVIFDDIPASADHNGGVIHFGPDGHLYVVTGDAGQAGDAQLLGNLRGKLLRLNDNGNPAQGNPFEGTSGARAEIYSFGHRNSFGFTFHPTTGDLWQTENGPEGNDEINHIIAGGNYGWPTVQGIAGHPNFVDPIASFSPSFAPTNIVAINSPHYPPEFQNNLLFVDFVQGKLRRLILDPSHSHLAAPPIESFSGNGDAIIALEQGPDGFIYASSSNTIFRVVPAP